MGQKIHPLGFRVNITQDHQSDWFAKTNHHPLVVMEDCFIRQFLFQEYHSRRITTIKIKRTLLVNQISVEITTPEYVHSKEDCKHLKRILQSKLKIFRAYNLYLNRSSSNFKIIENQSLLEEKYPLNVIIDYKLLRHKLLSASFYADMLVILFEKRTNSRKALTKVFKAYKKATSNPNINVKGIKIQISGRINGNEIARTEWTQKGRVPLHTLRADIDYSCKAAKTIYGILGIKVWLFREEIINHKRCCLDKETQARETRCKVSSFTGTLIDWNSVFDKNIKYYLLQHKEDLFTPDYTLLLVEAIKEYKKNPTLSNRFVRIPWLRQRRRHQQWLKKYFRGEIKKRKKKKTKPLTQLSKPLSPEEVRVKRKQALEQIRKKNRIYLTLFLKEIYQELESKKKKSSKKKKRRSKKSKRNKEIEIK